MNSAVAIEKVAYSINGHFILNDVSLAVERGESVAIVGPSGSGKSTLLMCVLGLVKPQSGRIVVNGADITRLGRRALAKYRRENVGIVFQFGELLPELTPVENVALAALLAGVRRDQAYLRARRLLDELGVPTMDAATAHLSGGERQRAAVARALITEPSILLADEPTGALDDVNRAAVTEMLVELPRHRGCSLLMVTHDEKVAQQADRRVVFPEGARAVTADEQGPVPSGRQGGNGAK